MAKDAIFRIYSMTKPLVSVGGDDAGRGGRIELTDPVARFLPAFKDQQVSVAKTDAFGKAPIRWFRPSER